jgi:hypothetical protein
MRGEVLLIFTVSAVVICWLKPGTNLENSVMMLREDVILVVPQNIVGANNHSFLPDTWRLSHSSENQ